MSWKTHYISFAGGNGFYYTFWIFTIQGILLVHTRHEKSSKPSADAILGYSKFPQIATFKFPQKPIICDKKYLFLAFKCVLES